MGPVFCLLMWVEAATAATGVAVAPSGFLMPSALYRGLRAVRAVVSQCLAVSRSVSQCTAGAPHDCHHSLYVFYVLFLLRH